MTPVLSNPLVRHVLATLLLFGVAAPVDLSAQQTSTGEETVEEIVVTGSRIVRRDFASPSPVSSLDRQTIEFSGQATLEEALNQMPQVQPSFGRTSNNPGDGTARLDLRGLGSDRTLVMLNGRRLAPSGVGSSVDVNNLPQSLIQRVEVITGGASTVYGSDAIAGVVNFITRDDVDGFSLDASTYTTEQGDSESTDVNVLYGRDFADGRGNIRVFGGVLDREASFAGDRTFSEVFFEDDYQGNLTPGGSFSIPGGVVFVPNVDLGNGLVFPRFDANGNPVEFINPDDKYNFAPVNYLQTPLRRYSGGLFLNYAHSERLESYVELTYARNESRENLAPVPVSSFFVINTDNPGITAPQQLVVDQFIPAGPNLAAFGFGRRLVEVGPRISEQERDYMRLVAGLRGSINDNWDYDIWITITDGDEKKLLLNDASASRLQQGLLVDPVTGQCFDPSGGCVPVELFGEGSLSAEATEFIRLAPLINLTTRRQELVSAFVTGPLFDAWAGPVDAAFGVEWRSDDGRFVADETLFSGDGLGFRGASGIDGREEVIELYAESIVPLAQDAPLAKRLAMEVGGRYSKYNNAGEVDSLKLGGEWQPVDSVRFRTMFQRSVRAPNLEEAFEERFIESGVFIGSFGFDPCSASSDPVANGNVEKCILQGLPADQIGIFEATFSPADTILGGNPALVPEEAETFTAGIVLDIAALENWRFAVDYFNLEVEDTIGSIDPASICFDPANTANLFCDNIRRNTVTYDVSQVLQITSNRGKSETSGIDMQIDYQAAAPEWLSIGNSGADLNVNVIWTHLLDKSTQENPVATPLECEGKFGDPCNQGFNGETFPDHRITANAAYQAGKLDIHLTWRWIDGSDNAAPLRPQWQNTVDPVLQIPSIGSKSYFDLGFGYAVSDNVRARLNIANLFDIDPPFMADAAFQNNTDTGMYDIFGRSYYLSFSLQY